MAASITPDQVNGALIPIIGRNNERLAMGGASNGDGTGALQVSVVSGSLSSASTANITSTAQSTSSQQLVAANTSRKNLYVYNDQQGNGAGNLYVSCGSAASTSNFTFRLAPNTGMALPIDYTGAVFGIWDTLTNPGNARVTEFS